MPPSWGNTLEAPSSLLHMSPQTFSGGRDQAWNRHPDAGSAPRVRILQHSSKLPNRNGRGSLSLCPEARQKPAKRRNGSCLRTCWPRTSLLVCPPSVQGEGEPQPRERRGPLQGPLQDKPGRERLSVTPVP